MLTRRDFIKTMSLLSGAVLAPVRWLGQWAGMPPVLAEEPPVEGELYAGFVLLPEGAAIPSFVECVSGAPILCRTENEQAPDVVALRGETLWFDTIEELRNKLVFPMYIPTSLPQNLALMHGYVIRFVQSQMIFSAKLDFGIEGSSQPLISLSAQTIFPQPYPIWPVRIQFADSDQESNAITPEKVEFTPMPGIMSPTVYGQILYWINHKVLYTLVVEHDPQRETAISIAKVLIEI